MGQWVRLRSFTLPHDEAAELCRSILPNLEKPTPQQHDTSHALCPPSHLLPLALLASLASPLAAFHLANFFVWFYGKSQSPSSQLPPLAHHLSLPAQPTTAPHAAAAKTRLYFVFTHSGSLWRVDTCHTHHLGPPTTLESPVPSSDNHPTSALPPQLSSLF